MPLHPMNQPHTPLPRRRGFMAAAASSLALPVLAQSGPTPGAEPKPAQGLERSRTRVAGFADAEMDYQLLRQLGTARYGGASVGECQALAQRIQNGDPASWIAQFAAAGARQQADAPARAQRCDAGGQGHVAKVSSSQSIETAAE